MCFSATDVDRPFDIREWIRLTGIAVYFRSREIPPRHYLETHKSVYHVSPLKSRMHTGSFVVA